MDTEDQTEKKLPNTQEIERPVTPPLPSEPQTSSAKDDDDSDYRYTDWASI